jgi:hypothetical protein
VYDHYIAWPHRGDGGDWDGFWLPPFSSSAEWVVAIYRLLQESAFGPEDVGRMVAAYEHALKILQLRHRTDGITELVASKIIEIASRGGMNDAEQISELAIKALGVPRPK